MILVIFGTFTNVSVDGTSYENITKIVTGGKDINLSGVAEGSDHPTGIAEIKMGSWTQQSDSSSDYTFAHGCSAAPDIVILDSNYRTRYTSESKPSNSTIVGGYYNSNVGKAQTYVDTAYTGTSGTNNQSAASPNSTNDGYISEVNSTSVVINAAANRLIGGGLTYKWIAIRLA